MRESAAPRVLVLLSTYNGEAHLNEQLDSIARQTLPCEIVVRDDGSSDSTQQVLERWRSRLNMTVSYGSNVGPGRSFNDLLVSAPSADYYAFADQDDVWDEDKLAVAVQLLSRIEDDQPALYFSATRVVDENLNQIRESVLHEREPLTFAGSLVRNVASGCTMVFNHPLRHRVTAKPYDELAMHDSWLYKVCLAVDGRVVYDPTPHIAYRQHPANAVGAEPGLGARALRWGKMPVRVRRSEASELLERYRSEMSRENVRTADLVTRYSDSVLGKARLLFDHGFRSGGDLASRISLAASILLERL